MFNVIAAIAQYLFDEDKHMRHICTIFGIKFYAQGWSSSDQPNKNLFLNYILYNIYIQYVSL
jgi:hypothetical protein